MEMNGSGSNFNANVLGNYPLRPLAMNTVITWNEVTNNLDRPQLKRCPSEVSLLTTMVNPITRLTSTEWLSREWKSAMYMRRIFLYVESLTHEPVSFERSDGKKRDAVVTSAILSNVDPVHEIKLEIIGWDENAVRLYESVRPGNVSDILKYLNKTYWIRLIIV